MSRTDFRKTSKREDWRCEHEDRLGRPRPNFGERRVAEGGGRHRPRGLSSSPTSSGRPPSARASRAPGGRAWRPSAAGSTSAPRASPAAGGRRKAQRVMRPSGAEASSRPCCCGVLAELGGEVALGCAAIATEPGPRWLASLRSTRSSDRPPRHVSSKSVLAMVGPQRRCVALENCGTPDLLYLLGRRRRRGH